MGRFRVLGVVALAAVLPLLWLALVVSSRPSDRTASTPATYPASRWGHGVTVKSVFGRSELRPQDRVVAVDAIPLDDWVSEPSASRRLHVGDQVRYTVVRNGQLLTVEVRLVRYPVGDVVRQLWPILAFASVLFVLGAFVLLRRPGDPAARALFLIGALMPYGLPAWPMSMQVVDLIGGRGLWPHLVGSAAWAMVWVHICRFALLFPEPPPPQWRHRMTIALYAAAPLLYLGYLALTLPSADTALLRLERTVSLSAAVQVVARPAVIVFVIWAYLRAKDPDSRRAIRWIVGSILLAAGTAIVLDEVPSMLVRRSILPWAVEPLLFVVCALTIAAGILRYRLFDIEVILKRSLMYAALAAVLAVLYLTVVLLVGGLVGDQPSLTVLGAGLAAALCLHPVLLRLRRWTGQWIFGQRDNPFEVVSRLAALHAQTTPQQLLSGLIETLAQTLRLSFARIELLAPDGSVSTVATYGTAHRTPVAVVMDALPDVRGRLLLDVGPGREPFGTADQKLLQAVAIHVGVALHTTLLAEALQRSRERLVTAREEERRRLQRDLHDGVGPTLAATAVQAEVAVELLQQDADAAQRALSLVARQSKEALAEIRRIVHSLRPPALDQLGLVAAIRERVATFDLVPDAAHPRGFRTSVVAEEELPHLPAAVEVAAFAIVLEAVSNTARHAAASLCQVRLWCDNGLQVEVTDDGEGLPPDATRGVGLLSMTERAAELGGECSVTNRPSRGTIVHARIPLMHREVATP